MESVSMCWILEETSSKETTESAIEETKEQEDAPEVTSVVCDSHDKNDSIIDGVPAKMSQKEDQEEKTNRSGHTLVDMNFRIKKGTLINDHGQIQTAFQSIVHPSVAYLTHVNFTGQLVAVVGAVGCGKSSLLSGLLGE